MRDVTRVTHLRHRLLIIFLFTNILSTVCVIQLANAGILDFVRKEVVSCQPKDRQCVLNAALDIAIKDFSSRDAIAEAHPYAMRAGRLYALAPPDQRQTVRQRWHAAGADMAFFATLDKTSWPLLPKGWLTVDLLKKALDSKEGPDGTNFADFVEFAFPVLLKEDHNAALSLWDEHVKMLWDDAFGTVTEVFEWMANNDVDALERYATRYNFPKSAAYNPWEELSQAAATFCDRGDHQTGERILAVFEKGMQRWKPEREKKAMDWSQLTAGVLGCRGEQAALDLVDPVLAQMNTDVREAREKYQQPQEQSFVVSVIRSRVAEGLIEPLTLHFEEAGHHQKAMNVFAQLPVQQSSMTLGNKAENGVYDMEFVQQSFAELLDLHRDDAFYDTDKRKALSWFLEKYDGANVGRGLEREADAIDMAGEIWPDPLARHAAEKALKTLADRANEDRTARQSAFDRARLRVGAFEKRSRGCEIADTTLTEILADAGGYEFAEQRSEMLIDYLRYLDTGKNGESRGDCIIQ
ncbi:hypothetical protein ACQY1H_05280 [Agrobacterium vitis]|uniref:hypothetical protein n=1 Tax=Agrobacterium vitis TaxID=373 RepID=UPI003D2B4813